ncbi:uncharacterized protein LOC115748907 [Rhodamnia argentea]|uniref:Uncharacterized protein LOC115748907 n=1 Tax=Rhodamnia argentea TaxID=178133 RepID=A0A8B8Q2V4_9MYRT|nr:uncharacterized protein LOC115748907 [Rhodamnia argentea]
MGIERCEPSPCTSPFTEDEHRVAEILLELRWLFVDRFPRGWGAKRRRSALRGGSSPPSPARPSPPPQPQPPKCPARAAIEDRVGPPKVHAASPDTPLSFSPSESDGNKAKQSHSKRKSTKRVVPKREEWLKLLPLLEEQGDALRKEVENVRRYRDQVKALNSMLKARKEELIIRVIPGEAKQGPEPSTRLTLGGQSAEPTAASLPSGSDRHLPSIPGEAASVPETSETRDPVGPGRDIPDLNIGLAPFDGTTLDEEWSSRARAAAEARQRRKLIYRAKNPTAAVKPRVQLR